MVNSKTTHLQIDVSNSPDVGETPIKQVVPLNTERVVCEEEGEGGSRGGPPEEEKTIGVGTAQSSEVENLPFEGESNEILLDTNNFFSVNQEDLPSLDSIRLSISEEHLPHDILKLATSLEFGSENDFEMFSSSSEISFSQIPLPSAQSQILDPFAHSQQLSNDEPMESSSLTLLSSSDSSRIVIQDPSLSQSSSFPSFPLSTPISPPIVPSSDELNELLLAQVFDGNDADSTAVLDSSFDFHALDPQLPPHEGPTSTEEISLRTSRASFPTSLVTSLQNEEMIFVPIEPELNNVCNSNSQTLADSTSNHFDESGSSAPIPSGDQLDLSSLPTPLDFEGVSSTSGLNELMRGGGGGGGRAGGGHDGGDNERQNVKDKKKKGPKSIKTVVECSYLLAPEVPKKRKRGAWGLSKVAYDKRVMQFRYLHNLMSYQKHKTSLSTVDLSTFSAVIAHFEAHHKKIKLHFPCNTQFVTFSPPNTYLNPRYSFFQPQYVRGSLVLICSMPNRNKGIRIIDTNTVKLSSGYSKGKKIDTRLVSVFYFVKDPMIEKEILHRITTSPSYEKVSVDFYPFHKSSRAELEAMKVPSMIFVLAIMLMFLEGQYCMTSVLSKLDMTRFSILEKTIVDRLSGLSEKPWIGSGGGGGGRERSTDVVEN